MAEIDKRKLRLGMIGGGPGAGIARVHRSAAYLDGEYELKAGAFSRYPSKSWRQGEALYMDPSRVYGAWEEMLDKESVLASDKRIDVVSIVTPNHAHYAQAKTALERGFHVILDKPMTMNVEEALDLREMVRKSGRILALTHPYASCSTIKLARDLVKNGHLGKITKVVVEYPQGTLNRLCENDAGNFAAVWRTDPQMAGSGSVGDIGTHAANLSETVVGRRIVSVSADVGTVVEGRKTDDDFTAFARWEGGIRGSIQASQISTGEGNGLNIRVYGEKAGLHWSQITLDYLTVMYLDKPWELWSRNTTYANAISPASARMNRCYSHHAEGYIEEFANVYYNAAQSIRCLEAGRTPSEFDLDFPSVEDGVSGMAFVEACMASSLNGSVWTDVKSY